MRRGKTDRKRVSARAGAVAAGAVAGLETLERRRLLAAHIVGGAQNFATIQAAVDAASPGQTITVDPGTYNEVVWISKANLNVLGPKTGVHGGSNTRGTGEARPGAAECRAAGCLRSRKVHPGDRSRWFHRF